MIVEDLYRRGIEEWNDFDADGLAELFILDGEIVGVDGTAYTGRGAVLELLRALFATGKAPKYVGKIQGITTVTTDVAIVRALAGLIPHGASKPDPALHVVHRLTAVFRGGDWRIALWHITPARYDGRADAVAKHAEELDKP